MRIGIVGGGFFKNFKDVNKNIPIVEWKEGIPFLHLGGVDAVRGQDWR